jgi:uncharacterized pyridoxamine 5'-phosphate oxidase family protein
MPEKNRLYFVYNKKGKMQNLYKPSKRKNNIFLRGCKMRLKLVNFHIYTINIEDIKCKKMPLHFHGTNIKII